MIEEKLNLFDDSKQFDFEYNGITFKACVWISHLGTQNWTDCEILDTATCGSCEVKVKQVFADNFIDEVRKQALLYYQNENKK